jgi:hypothetical protein
MFELDEDDYKELKKLRSLIFEEGKLLEKMTSTVENPRMIIELEIGEPVIMRYFIKRRGSRKRNKYEFEYRGYKKISVFSFIKALRHMREGMDRMETKTIINNSLGELNIYYHCTIVSTQVKRAGKNYRNYHNSLQVRVKN